MTIKFGLGILSGQVPPGSARSIAEEYADILRFAELAERLRFDSVWLTEHHLAADGYLPSVLPMLAAIAARTSRLALGSATILAPFHHPLRLAEDAAVVDQLSNGRLILGLALGWREEEFRGFGIPMRQRAQRLEEMVAVLRHAWTGERFTFQGRHFQFDRVRITPIPAHRIPIWIGGGSPRAIERAATIGDGYVASKTAVSDLAAHFAIAESAARAGSNDHLELGVMLDLWVGAPSPDVWKGLWYKTHVYQLWRQGQDSPTAELTLPESPPDPPTLFLHGDPAHLIPDLRQYAQLARGRDLTLIVRLHYPGMPYARTAAAMRRFAEEVMPQIAEVTVATDARS